ncbi:hypothetical protein BGZ96_006607 [Linnemannia gamsii]|uniref:HCP-like protein n=1 Tax=Linnemannia gamsii TaxID=64522 RepID=A0ABQ7K3C0_9FUNG|nr:hypothetical protein BGZ96_006607 [Linnemannia gamsii]
MVQRPIRQGFRLVTPTTPTNTHTNYDRQPSPDSTSSSPSSYSSSSTFLSSLTDRGDVLFVEGHKDPATKKNIVLWDDILIPFQGATYIRQGANVVPFLKSHDLKNVEPLRIALVPDVILEVVVAQGLSAGETVGTGTVTREPSMTHNTMTATVMEHLSKNHNKMSNKDDENDRAQEIEFMMVDEMVDMFVKEEPRGEEVGPFKAVKVMERETVKAKEKEKKKEKAPNLSNNHNNSSNNNTPSNIIFSNNTSSSSGTNLNNISLASNIVNSNSPNNNKTHGSTPNNDKTNNSTPNNCNSDSSNINNNTTNSDRAGSSINNCDKKKERDEDVVGAEWELMAAEGGDVEAQFRVGYMFRHGQGLPQSFAKSKKWYLRAAEQNHRNAQFQLGMLLEYGDHNVAKDLVTAADWYRMAAELDHPEAQFRLGALYAKGTGVPLDDNMALIWYTKAAEQGVELAQLAVGIQYQQGHNGMPPDRPKALIWLHKAAAKGNPDAQHLIGMYCYSEYSQGGGRGFRANYAKAMEWFLKAATNERRPHAGAQENIAFLYLGGRGVAKDYAKAKEWYHKSMMATPSKDGKDLARYYYIIGNLHYLGGPGMAQDYREAMTWFMKAVEAGHVEACYMMGLCCERTNPNGEGDRSAMEWFRLAAVKGHRKALRRVHPLPLSAQKRKQTSTPSKEVKKRKTSVIASAEKK